MSIAAPDPLQKASADLKSEAQEARRLAETFPEGQAARDLNRYATELDPRTKPVLKTR